MLFFNVTFIRRILEAKSEFHTKNPTPNAPFDYPTINFISHSQTLNNLLFTLHATYGSHHIHKLKIIALIHPLWIFIKWKPVITSKYYLFKISQIIQSTNSNNFICHPTNFLKKITSLQTSWSLLQNWEIWVH